MNKSQIITAALLALSPVCATTFAAVISFANQSQWLAAVGPISGTETFDLFAGDAQFRTTSIAASNMRISAGFSPNTGTGLLTNKIDVQPFEFTASYAFGPTPYLLSELVSPEVPDLRIDFINPVTAWGAEIHGIADASVLDVNRVFAPRTRLDVFDASNNLLGTVPLASVYFPATFPSYERQFYGFEVTGAVADHIVFTNPSTLPLPDVFGIDNILFVTAAPVPEPGSLVLIGIAVIGFVIVRPWQAAGSRRSIRSSFTRSAIGTH